MITPSMACTNLLSKWHLDRFSHSCKAQDQHTDHAILSVATDCIYTMHVACSNRLHQYYACGLKMYNTIS